MSRARRGRPTPSIGQMEDDRLLQADFCSALNAEYRAYLLGRQHAARRLASPSVSPTRAAGSEIADGPRQSDAHRRFWQSILAAGCVFENALRPPIEGELQIAAAVDGVWKGSPLDLYRLLTGPASRLSADEKRKIPCPSWIGQRLRAVQRERPDLVEYVRTGAGRRWHLTGRPGWLADR